MLERKKVFQGDGHAPLSLAMTLYFRRYCNLLKDGNRKSWQLTVVVSKKRSSKMVSRRGRKDERKARKGKDTTVGKKVDTRF